MVVNVKKNKLDLESIVFEIAEHKLDSNFLANNDTLFKGNAGISLFFYELNKYKSEKRFLDRSISLFLKSFDEFKTHNMINFALGSSGIMWLLEYYRRENAFDTNFEDILGAKATTFIDTINNPMSHVYHVLVYDSCNNTSSVGRIAKPILLSGEIKGQNEYAILNYSNYEKWENGVKEYDINIVKNANSRLLERQSNNSSFIDHDYLINGKTEKCYQIVAKENKTGQTSKSNVLCLPYLPMIHVPNAFSPNNDGLNDLFKPKTYGVHSYSIKIYNRWGQTIYSGNDGEWDGTYMGKVVPTGAYSYVISFVINEQTFTKTKLEKGTVIVQY